MHTCLIAAHALCTMPAWAAVRLCESVQIWDMQRHLQELQSLTPQSLGDQKQPHASVRVSPKHAHRHPQEGYALDWSRAAQGKLASGDTANQIMIHEPAESRWAMSGPYVVSMGTISLQFLQCPVTCSLSGLQCCPISALTKIACQKVCQRSIFGCCCPCCP